MTHKCWKCGHEIQYGVITYDGRFRVREESTVEPIAVGVLQGSEGKIVEYEAIATCIECDTKNKVKFTSNQFE